MKEKTVEDFIKDNDNGRLLKIRSRMTYRLAVGYTFLGGSDNSRIASEKTLMGNVDGRSYSSFCLLRSEKQCRAYLLVP